MEMIDKIPIFICHQSTCLYQLLHLLVYQNTPMLKSLSDISKIPPALKVHEWLAIAILVAILTSLALMASASKGEIGDKERDAPAFMACQGKIEIMVKGAVVFPGIYCVPSSASMKDVIMLAKATPETDLRRFQSDRPIKRGRSINVPTRKMVTVHLKGAVKVPGTVTLPKGSSLEDLLSVVEFADNANLKVLRKKRKLKDGEEVEVPVK